MIVPRGTLPLETLERCPICRSEKCQAALEVTDHFLSKETFQLMECQACGFRFTNPRPEQAEIGKYYQSEEYLSHSASQQGLFQRLYSTARKWAIGRKHSLITRYQRQGRVLDLGCGTGEFLSYLAAQGYQVEGVEPSIKAREIAIAEHGLHVVPSLTHIPHREYYHVITLWHVLEHVPDVRTTFKQLYALLADRGLLVIAVPDRDSWDAQHYGPHWAAWDIPRHLSHFRRTDLFRLLNEHGFEAIAEEHMWLDAYYIALLSEKYKGHGPIAAAMLACLKGTWSNVLAALGKRPTSSSLIIARKHEP